MEFSQRAVKGERGSWNEKKNTPNDKSINLQFSATFPVSSLMMGGDISRLFCVVFLRHTLFRPAFPAISKTERLFPPCLVDPSKRDRKSFPIMSYFFLLAFKCFPFSIRFPFWWNVWNVKDFVIWQLYHEPVHSDGSHLQDAGEALELEFGRVWVTDWRVNVGVWQLREKKLVVD